MTDQYFTPKNIASSLVLGLTTNHLKNVADFAIGDGSLLNALPFKPQYSIGLDLDKNVIKRLREKNPKWILKTGNFLTPNITTSKWLRKWENKIDLILLNPPFSNKGGSYQLVSYKDENVRCRIALAFVLKAIKYLKKDGILIAILPLSILKSTNDIATLRHIESDWKIEFGQRLDKNSFIGCSPNSIILTLTKREDKIEKVINIEKTNYTKNLFIIRGTTPMFKTQDRGTYPVLHSTNLKFGELVSSNIKYVNKKKRCISGSFLCIPRVGSPSSGNIIIIESNTEFVLSDCLFAIMSNDTTTSDLVEIKETIIKDLDNFKCLYDSTCAPYVTIKQLEDYFKKVKIKLNIISDRSELK